MPFISFSYRSCWICLIIQRGRGETFRHITMNVAKGELEISTESSPALQTHISSCPSSTPPGCLLSSSCLQMTPPSLHTVSPFQSLLNIAARVRLLQSQSIAPEANIIFYVNYTSRKKVSQITLLLSQNLPSGFLSPLEESPHPHNGFRVCVIFVPLGHSFSGFPAASACADSPDTLPLRALGAVSVWNIQMST